MSAPSSFSRDGSITSIPATVAGLLALTWSRNSPVVPCVIQSLFINFWRMCMSVFWEGLTCKKSDYSIVRDILVYALVQAAEAQFMSAPTTLAYLVMLQN